MVVVPESKVVLTVTFRLILTLLLAGSQVLPEEYTGLLSSEEQAHGFKNRDFICLCTIVI